MTAAVAWRFSSLVLSAFNLRDLPWFHRGFAGPQRLKFLNADVVFLDQLIEVDPADAELARRAADDAAVAIERLIRFSSSRTLPGHGCISSAPSPSGESVTGGLRCSLQNFLRKCCASGMISSLRSRSGGISSGTTFSR